MKTVIALVLIVAVSVSVCGSLAGFMEVMFEGLKILEHVTSLGRSGVPYNRCIFSDELGALLPKMEKELLDAIQEPLSHAEAKEAANDAVVYTSMRCAVEQLRDPELIGVDYGLVYYVFDSDYPPRTIIGTWYRDTPDRFQRIIIYSVYDRLYMDCDFLGGYRSLEALIEIPSSKGRRFEERSADYDGEYFLLDDLGNLQLGNELGIFEILEKLP